MISTHYLATLLEPQSLAVVGASENEGSLGGVVFHNIRTGGFTGKLWPVNPAHDTISGIPCVPSVDKIEGRVDAAIVATAPHTVPRIIEQCGAAGIRNIILVTDLAGEGAAAKTLERRTVDAARALGVRILGPKSLGIIRPRIHLNATFTQIPIAPGDLGLVAQSGAMSAAVLDWAAMNKIGVSSMVTLGSAIDVDFGEILDYLVADPCTRYILMHVERVRNARRFMSALRSAARAKPVILLKSGLRSGATENGATENDGPLFEDLAQADAVFDAAVRRAGVVRVQSISQLFYAAKALASNFHPRGNRLAIISNGTGPGAMAEDCARRLGIPLAPLTSDTVAAMKAFMPRDWNGANPIDLGGDANPERYLHAIRALARDANLHATMVVLSPLALAQPREVAKGIVEIARSQRMALCCCFMGGEQIAEARKILEDAGIPVFRTPDTVIELFYNISKYYQNQKLLLQTPSPIQDRNQVDLNTARPLVETLLAERRTVLHPLESKALLAGFGIPVLPGMVARTPMEAMFAAHQFGTPVFMRLNGPTQRHDHDESVGRISHTSADSVKAAFRDIVEANQDTQPDVQRLGILVEPHLPRPHGRALMVRVFRDPVFGPVISLGAGGNSVETFRDRAVALPPLNHFLARDMIDSTRVSRTLGRFRQLPPVDRQALETILLRVSSMVCELPWIRELDINPLVVDDEGAVAEGAHIVIDHALGAGLDRYAHMAIHPYPAHYCQEWSARDGTAVTIRPVRPEDATLEQEFIRSMSDESRRFRFMDAAGDLPASLIVRMTQLDYDREMALIATISERGKECQIGSVRYTLSPDGESVEFALAVADQWQQCGLGRRLMEVLLDCARAKSYRTMAGDVLADNKKMLRLMAVLGFSIVPHKEEPSMRRVVKPLNG